jgi:hypothetical protein
LPVNIAPTQTVGEFKDLVKTEKAVKFNDIDADKLTLWHVDIPVVAADRHNAVLLDTTDSKEELLPTSDLSEVFGDNPPKKTIHIIVQRPPAGKTPSAHYRSFRMHTLVYPTCTYIFCSILNHLLHFVMLLSDRFI